MEENRESAAVVEPRRAGARERFDQQTMLRYRIDMRAAGLTVPARDTRQAVGDVFNFDI